MLLVLAGLGLYAAIKISIYQSTKPYVYQSMAEAPTLNTTLVLGAQVFPGQIPSKALANRLETAIELYKKGKTNMLLMSGDGRSNYYNEVTTMTRFAEASGVPSKAILQDESGLRTYDSCSRAKTEFLLHDVLIVTQKDHLLRAVYTCRSLGLNAYGVEAAPFNSQITTWAYWQNWGRERAALILAWFDVHIFNP